MNSFAVDALWQVLNGIFSWKIVVAAAEIAWFPVYFLMIREAYRTKSCGQPLIGMCAILVQCFIYATFGPYWRPDLFPHNPYAGGSFGVVWVWRLWFVVQAIGLYQFFKYHDPQKHRYDASITGVNLKRFVVLLLVLNLFAQWTFIIHFRDVNVNASDPLAYMFLAVGFVLLALNRPDHVGLSYPAAWLKLFATAVIYASTFVNPLVSYGAIATGPIPGEYEEMPTKEEAELLVKEIKEGEQAVLQVIGEFRCGGDQTPDCPPEISSLLEKENLRKLARAGWRIAGPDSIFSTSYGVWDVIHQYKDDPNALQYPVGTPDPTSWKNMVNCLIHPQGKLDPPVWEPRRIPQGNVFSCADGTVRMQFAFPLFMSIACVGFDALYVYLLWDGRRKRKAAALAGAVGSA